MFYHAKSMRTLPSWVTKSPKARVVAEIGGHLFYAGID
jgi:hypothetical protein